MHPDDLEELIGRELGRLPRPRAPLTLVPRVMAAVRAWAARPWYQRAWFTWPAAWQALTLALVVTAASGMVLAVSRLDPLVAGASSTLAGSVGPWLNAATTTVGVVRALSHAIVEPALDLRLLLLAIVLLVSAVSVGIAAALGRVAFSSRTQQS